MNSVLLIIAILGSDTAPTSARQQPAMAQSDGQQAFQIAEAVWEGCERPLREETARRMARRLGVQGLGDCGREAQALEAAIQALPTDAEKRAARAVVQAIEERIEQSARTVYDANNYE
jgi:hypothetical protein